MEATFKAGAKPTLDACWNAAYSEYWDATKFCFENGVTVEAFAYVGSHIFLEVNRFNFLAASLFLHAPLLILASCNSRIFELLYLIYFGYKNDFQLVCLADTFSVRCHKSQKEKDIFGFFGSRGMMDAVLYVAERLGKPSEEKMFEMLCSAVCFDKYLPLVKHIVLQWGFGPAQFQTATFSKPWPLHVACAWRAPETMKYARNNGPVPLEIR